MTGWSTRVLKKLGFFFMFRGVIGRLGMGDWGNWGMKGVRKDEPEEEHLRGMGCYRVCIGWLNWCLRVTSGSDLRVGVVLVLTKTARLRIVA